MAESCAKFHTKKFTVQIELRKLSAKVESELCILTVNNLNVRPPAHLRLAPRLASCGKLTLCLNFLLKFFANFEI